VYIALPEGIITLPFYCFKNCYSLGKVSFPSSLQKFPDGYFSHFFQLININIPDGVSEIT
jgi:hypothetical protein